MQKLNITDFFKVVLISILIIWTYLIIEPFLSIIIWGAILAVVLFPFYSKRIAHQNKRKNNIRTTLFTVIILFALIYPIYFLISTVSTQTMEGIEQIKQGSIEMPAPNEKLKEIPVVGENLYNKLQRFRTNSKEVIIENKDFIIDKIKMLFGQIGGFIEAILILIGSFLAAVAFMVYSDYYKKSITTLLQKFVGNQATDIMSIINNTIINVVKGILFIAILQSALTFLSFWAFDIPFSLAFTLVVFILCIVQVPLIVTAIPAIILAFSTLESSTSAIIFSVLTLVIASLDNFIKPYLISKGLKTPVTIIFLGVIGGVIFHGVVGLFIGPVLFGVLHALYVNWINSETINQ